MNALLVLALPVLALFVLRRRPIPLPAAAVVLVAFAVVRNLPMFTPLGT